MNRIERGIIGGSSESQADRHASSGHNVTVRLTGIIEIIYRKLNFVYSVKSLFLFPSLFCKHLKSYFIVSRSTLLGIVSGFGFTKQYGFMLLGM